MSDYYNPWPRGSEWWQIVEEMNRQARDRRMLRAFQRMLSDPELGRVECPVCQGHGTIGQALGARDDEERR